MNSPTALTPSRIPPGRARISDVSEVGTEIVVESASDTPRKHLVPAVPDPDLAGRLARSVDRVLWQRLEADGSHSTVAAVRRHRPVYLRASPRAALGLLGAGLPTVIAGEARP